MQTMTKIIIVAKIANVDTYKITLANNNKNCSKTKRTNLKKDSLNF